jgi:predicted RNA binding protein YcfA (HicA-like mRNA interferase family)
MPKVRDAIRQIEQAGWYLVRTRGDHRQYKHPDKPGLVTVPGARNDDLPPGTWASIMKQAGVQQEGER